MKNFQRTLILGCSLVALAGCGADEIVSPGTGGNINVNIDNSVTNPAPTATPTPTPTQSLVTAASGCPTIASSDPLFDAGTLSGPTGTYRVCRLPARIDRPDLLPFVRGLVYEIGGRTGADGRPLNDGGRVDVGFDRGFAPAAANVAPLPSSLTIEPGVILFATGDAYLVVNRGNTISSNGSADRPIIWTSRDNIIGLANGNSQQQWGGVVLLGNAPISDCSNGVFNTAASPTNNPTCESQLEGAATATPFGGAQANSNSGSFRFNQIRFSGFELAPNNELQSLTTGGVGSATVIENLLSYNSSDDGVEFFGGGFNVRNLAVIGASDDSLDVDTGALVNVDTMIAVQRSTTGDRLIELDSPNVSNRTPSNAIPQTRLQVNNFTFAQRGGSPEVIQARGGAALGLTNGVMRVTTPTPTAAGATTINNPCFQIDEAPTLTALIGIDSVVANCDTNGPVDGSGGVTPAQVLAAVNAGSNNSIAFTITLTNGVVNGTGETARTAFNANARSSFFPTRTFVGAIQNDAALASTFGNWTCNSGTQNFNSTTGTCISLPIYPA